MSPPRLTWLPLVITVLCWGQVFFVLDIRAQVASGEVETRETLTAQERPFFGAFLKDTDHEQARELGVTAKQGAVITRVTTNSPAAQAGLLPGDVIVVCDGQSIDNAMAFYRLFRNFHTSQKIELKIQRGDQTLEVSATLTALKMPVPQPIPTTPQPTVEKPSETLPGLVAGQPAALSYQHPRELYRLQLPAGWQVNFGMRGRVRQEGFDTLVQATLGSFMICAHEPLPGLRGLEGLEEFRRGQLQTLVNEEVNATGYSLSDRPWIEISYLSSESGQRVARLATLAPDGNCYYFMCVGSENIEELAFSELKTNLLQAIRFAQWPTGTPTGGPGPRAIPETSLPLKGILQMQPRVVGLTAVPAGHPKAIELGIEAYGGAVVTEVYANTPAAQVGLRPKDVIVQFGAHEIHTLEDCQTAIWTSPVNSLQPVVALRDNRRLTFQVRIAPDTTQRLVIQQYRHSSGAYQFNFLPRWKLHPNASRDERTGRIYDLIESEYGGYQVRLFHDRKPVAAAIDALYDFINEETQTFFDGSDTKWYLIHEVPLVYVSGLTHRSQYTVYRLAFVMEQLMYEIDVIAPSVTNPAKLPLVLQAMLGSLRQ
jgi:membrane-associated protease RseP (regulator of RpoE activity)